MRLMTSNTILTFALMLFSIEAFCEGMSKEECRRSAQTEQRINLSAGVYTEKAQVTTPLHINLPATLNEETYFECLLRNQLIDNESAERYLAKQDDCRKQTQLLSVTKNEQSARIGSSNDEVSYSRCMDSTIGVEVLENTK